MYEIEDEFDACCKFRYRQKDNPVHIKKINDNTVLLTYPQLVKAVTCGQEAVFYLNDICLGGGVIDKVYRNNVDMDEFIKEKLNAK